MVNEPMLTLNTSMHTARINHISIDQRGRHLLTCSNDKTAKLWDLASFELIRTFRPPFGTGGDGMLFACALSYDGNTAAVGGSNADNDFYLFDVNTGSIVKTLTGLPGDIQDIAFSPDGRFLGMVHGGSNGMRVYRTSDYSIHFEDKNYSEISYGIAFDTWGRIATASYDGYLRCYNNDGTLHDKVLLPEIKNPCATAFSPDGSLLAVVGSDSPTVHVLDAYSLKILYSPDISGIESNKGLFEICFSTDGTLLAAGGQFQSLKDGAWQFQLRVWQEGGKGTYSDFSAGRNSIQDIQALPNGNFVTGGFMPDWCIINPQNEDIVYYKEGETLDYSARNKSHFCVTPGGLEVGITPLRLSPFQFSLPNRLLSQTEAAFSPPVTERNGLLITDWEQSTHPKLNDKNLNVLYKWERSLSADIAVGGAAITLGADWVLYCLDPKGNLRWEVSTQSSVWCVKIDDYRLVVLAGLADGTIRWYRFHDGKPLLSLYVHPDLQRWILWTPSGYFDAAPGAMDLIGWHVNNGPDKAGSYYPVSQFRDTYHRPDVIDLILETVDEAEALRRAGEESQRRVVTAPVTAQLPPIVRIQAPANGDTVGNTSLKVDYTVDAPYGERVTLIRILVDGRPVLIESHTGEAKTIEIPAADCSVSVIAENRFGASEPATVNIKWQEPETTRAGRTATAAPSLATIDLRPKLYVLSIGVGQYEHPDINSLKFAAKDASDFLEAVQKQHLKLFQDVKSKLFTDAEATKDNILDGLEWLQRETTSRDVAMIFFAGHGVDDNAGNFFFLPTGANPESLKRTGVAQTDVQSTVASVAGKIIVFMDACHSGGLMQIISPHRRTITPDVNAVINELISAENGAIVFSSCTSRQYALENPAWNNGAFTKAVVEGFYGAAMAPNSQKITVKSLDAYVAERVKSLTAGKQSPTTNYPPNVPDFPVGVFG